MNLALSLIDCIKLKIVCDFKNKNTISTNNSNINNSSYISPNNSTNLNTNKIKHNINQVNLKINKKKQKNSSIVANCHEIMYICDKIPHNKKYAP